MLQKLCRRAALCAALAMIFSLAFMAGGRFTPAPALYAAGLGELWDSWAGKADSGPKSKPSKPSGPAIESSLLPSESTLAGHAGRHIGSNPELAAFAQDSAWAHRDLVYELYYDKGSELARSVYSLALIQNDVPPETELRRFERGVQGYHYSMEQVLAWARWLLEEKNTPRTPEEQSFMSMLLSDSVLKIDEAGRVVATGKVKHVLGAAAGRKRDFADNLAHERLHVLWDEDPRFSEAAYATWEGLDDRERREVFERLKGYSQDNLPQLIEEWAVFEFEKIPPDQRRALVGI